MAGTGQAPNPNSRRQATPSQAGLWTDLPAEGFDGEVPEWPFVEAAARELEVWAAVWRTPQAVMWARNGWTSDVALYVRCQVRGEGGSLDYAKEARMWSDRLGLNPAAMLKNRWRVRGDEVGTRRSAATAAPAARKRLKVADHAVAGS